MFLLDDKSHLYSSRWVGWSICRSSKMFILFLASTRMGQNRWACFYNCTIVWQSLVVEIFYYSKLIASSLANWNIIGERIQKSLVDPHNFLISAGILSDNFLSSSATFEAESGAYFMYIFIRRFLSNDTSYVLMLEAWLCFTLMFKVYDFCMQRSKPMPHINFRTKRIKI